MAAGCGGGVESLRVDCSSTAACEASLKRIRAALPESERADFGRDLAAACALDLLGRAVAGDRDGGMDVTLKPLDGLTVREIRVRAEANRVEMRKRMGVKAK